MIGKKKRFRVLQRCGFKCQYCGRHATVAPIEIDHVIPRSLGGSDDDANLVAACSDCNQGKGSDVAMRAEEVELEDGTFATLYPNYAIRSAMRELGLWD